MHLIPIQATGGSNPFGQTKNGRGICLLPFLLSRKGFETNSKRLAKSEAIGRKLQWSFR